MGEAFLWGIVASSSLILGGLIVMRFKVSSLVLGLVMAFGAGVLISSVAFEIVEEAFAKAGKVRPVGFGLLAGSIVFFIGDALVDRMGGEHRKRSGGQQASGSAMAIVLGIVLDGIPESVVLGLTVLEGGAVSIAFLAAVFLSNLPESVAATSGLLGSGWARGRVLGLWLMVTAVCGVAALAGYALFDSASPSVVAFVLAFAGGAILTMLADTMMPEAYEHGGKLVGFATTIGFGIAFLLSGLE